MFIAESIAIIYAIYAMSNKTMGLIWKSQLLVEDMHLKAIK